tara:strand:+ start:329 stop:673 length:345 start_codon:yes stop_codon:yes gene_type:complete
MTAIKTDRRVVTAMMEIHANTSDVWYSEKQLKDSPLWYCSDCGLLWDREWQAEQCGTGTYMNTALKKITRNHCTEFPQHYGGHTEQMLGSPERWIPSATYIRKSYGRIKIKETK